MTRPQKVPDWETLLAHAAMLQAKVPSAILLGGELKIPTIEEMLRIKTFLVVERNATRDYLDVTALSHYLGLPKSVRALERMNELYAEFAGEGGDVLITATVKFSNPDPYDLTDGDLTEYKGIIAPWNDWRAVEKQCLSAAVALLRQSPEVARRSPRAIIDAVRSA